MNITVSADLWHILLINFQSSDFSSLYNISSLTSSTYRGRGEGGNCGGWGWVMLVMISH